jgi:non-specific serine/threonine protein kinase
VSLPAEVTTYIGRQAEIFEVRRLLGTASLVTLIGPGGVGKTRLALRVVADVGASLAADVVFVGLAELREPELLVNTVAGRLGLGNRSARPPMELLVDQIRERRLLLVLDNCEHLVEACAQFVNTLLASCPDLVVLATSRQSLGVHGEHVVPVPPLDVPEPGESMTGLDQYDAVRLFVDRATAVVPSFAVTEDNIEDVTRLCRALDGLPLAIELAAVRLRSLSVRQLADRLNKRFTLLTGGRRLGPGHHTTLQALIDWSHELCAESERLLWARASVFSGSFELDAVEEVCSGEGLDRQSVLDVLDSLIDKSVLLREEGDGVARYRMLETVRQYGEDRLIEAGDRARMRCRHRAWYLELTRRFAAEWFGPDQRWWIDLFSGEHANLRAALEYCLTDPDEAVVGLRMWHNVKEYWITRRLSAEGRIWISKLLDVAPTDALDRVNAYWMYAFLALVQGDVSAFETALGEADRLAEEADDEMARAFVNHVRAYAALIDGAGDQSAKLFRAAADTFGAHRDRAAELWSTYNYGLALALAGDLDGCRAVLRDCVEACVARGEVFWRAWALWSRSAAEYLFGEMSEAEAAGLEVLRLQEIVDDQLIIAFSLTVLAGCATHTDRPHRAARLLGAATTLWRSLGASPDSYAAFVGPMRRDVRLVTATLGVAEAARQFTEGTAMPVGQAVSYALGEQPAASGEAAGEAIGGGTPVAVGPRARRGKADLLTRRESEVAALVAKGMTNREIADQLVIARRTAETHVDHIMTKLGFTSRAQIAAWVVRGHRC